MARQAAYDWGAGRDARLAIERLDKPIAPQRPDAAEIARRLKLLAAFPARFGGFAMGYVADQLTRGFVNRLEHDDCTSTPPGASSGRARVVRRR